MSEQGDWNKEQISISHSASVSGFTFYFVSSPAATHPDAASAGPGSSHVQMCRAYLCFHCTPGFYSSWDASTSVTSASFPLPFIPFCPPSHLVPPSLSPFRVFLSHSLAYKTLSKSGSEPSGLLLNGGNWQHMCLSAAKQTTHTHTLTEKQTFVMLGGVWCWWKLGPNIRTALCLSFSDPRHPCGAEVG